MSLAGLTLGCVDYINALPISLPLRSRKVSCEAKYVFETPNVLNSLLFEGKLDGAFTSSIGYLDGDYQLLSGYGIASFKQILSVNFYTRCTLSELSGKKIGLTEQSSTSVALLKILCQFLWKIAPSFELLNRQMPISTYSALLLIGDEALKNRILPGFQTIDLCNAWYNLTGLPFVFALFLLRKGIEKDQMLILDNQMQRAIEWSMSHTSFIQKEALKQCPIKRTLMQRYYSILNYRLGQKEMESLNLFKSMRAVHV